MTFSPGWIWTNYSFNPSTETAISSHCAQNNNVSNFLILQTYLSAYDIIPVSSSARNLWGISSLTLSIVRSLIDDGSICDPNLCHFRWSETSVEDYRSIFFLFLQDYSSCMMGALSPANYDRWLVAFIRTLASIMGVNLNKLSTHDQNSLCTRLSSMMGALSGIPTMITPILKKLHWLPIKQRID